jgi:hypothetical protein
MAEQKLLDKKKLQQKDDAAGDTGKKAPRKDAPARQRQKTNGSETSTTGQ